MAPVVVSEHFAPTAALPLPVKVSSAAGFGEGGDVDGIGAIAHAVAGVARVRLVIIGVIVGASARIAAALGHA